MASLNKVFLVGNLTKDPEMKFLPSGQALANLRVATNRKYKSGDTWKDEVTYVSVEVWGKSAEAVGEYLKKGSPLLVEGRLKLNEWTAQDGQKRSMLHVVAERVQFLSSAGHKAEAGAGDVGGGEGEGVPPEKEDEIPF